MMRYIGATALVMAGLAQISMARAEVPKVVTDIAPIQSLAAQVMQGLGKPEVILPPGASPHGYAMRPSEATALQQADLVVWVGEALTPWLEGPVHTLAAQARGVELLEVEGTTLLEFREGIALKAHDHHEGEHAHDDGDGHEEDHDHDDGHEAEHAHDDAQDHTHGAVSVDPHAWLAPDNAKLWLSAIAEALAEADPANAARYRANAAEGQAEISAAEQEIGQSLAPARDLGYMVFHDAYQYFEAAFDLRPVGAIAVSDASAPGPARVSALRAQVKDSAVRCVFSEPQYSASMIDTVFEGHVAQHAVLDPLGSEIMGGPGFYTALLRQIAERIIACAEGVDAG